MIIILWKLHDDTFNIDEDIRVWKLKISRDAR